MQWLLDLLPAEATQCELADLRMYGELEKPGVYVALDPSGDRAAVGLASVKKRMWVAHEMDGRVCCQALLELDLKRQRASYTGLMTKLIYDQGVETPLSAYSDSDLPGRRVRGGLRAWAKDKLTLLLA